MNIWISIGVTVLIGIYFVINFTEAADKLERIEKKFRRKK